MSKQRQWQNNGYDKTTTVTKQRQRRNSGYDKTTAMTRQDGEKI
jgi:hypothetical protein